MLNRKSILGLFLLALLATSQVATGQDKEKKVADGAKDAKAAKPKDLIVGTWEMANPKKGEEPTVTFTKQGSVILEAKAGLKMEGTYKFLSDEMMEVELKPIADLTLPPHKQKMKVKVSKDELAMIDEKGKESKFKRKR